MNDSSPKDEMTSSPAASTSRRSFLARFAVLGLIPASAGLIWKYQHGSHAGKESAGKGTGSRSHALADFLPLVGSEFSPVQSGDPVLTLSKAEAGKFHQPGVSEQFSLRFTAPDGHPFESRLYSLAHPSLGRMEIFISPVGSALAFGLQQKGEAVFNHSV